MQWKRRAARLLYPLAAWILAGWLLALSGCTCSSGKVAVRTERPYENLQLVVACPSDEAAKVIEAYKQSWASREGAQVRLIRFQPGEDPRSAGDADIWVLSPAEMPRFVVADQLQSIPLTYLNRGAEFAWDELLPTYGDKLSTWAGTPYALPIVGEAPLCFYRADLFNDAKHQAAFQTKVGRKLTPPETWQEFAVCAEYFRDHAEGGKPSPSLPPLPEADDALDRLYYQVAAPFARKAIPEEVEFFSFHYDMETGKPRIRTPGFVAALKLLQQLQACRPQGTHKDPNQTFVNGEAALCIGETSLLAELHNAKGGLFSKVRVNAMPGSNDYFSYDKGEKRSTSQVNRVSYLGGSGWMGVVPRRSPHGEAAFSFLTDLSGPKTSRQIVIEPEWGGGALRREHFDKAEGWSAFGFDQVQTVHLVESLRKTLEHRGTRNAVVRLRTPDQREHSKVLVDAIRTALMKNEDAAKTLQSVAQQWEELDAKKDPKKHLDEYMLSLTLQPTR